MRTQNQVANKANNYNEHPVLPGGELREREPEFLSTRQAVLDDPRIRVLKKATAFGCYEDRLVAVQTGDRMIRLRANQVVVATGGSGPGPFSWFRRRIVPVGSFAVATAPLSDELVAELFPGNRSYVTSKNIGNYFRLTPDQRLLFGGRARFAVSNPKSDAKSGVILRQSLDNMFGFAGKERLPTFLTWHNAVLMTKVRVVSQLS